MSMTQTKKDCLPDQEGKNTKAKYENNIGSELISNPNKIEDHVPMDLESSFINSFPEILLGEAFIAYASKQLETWDRFASIVLCPDPIEDNGSENQIKNPLLMLILAEALDTTCKIKSGFWGMYFPNCLACFIEVKDHDHVSLITNMIREQLNTLTNSTFSMGIATYPQLSYDRNEILENAYKALHHAHLLGRNSTVRFNAVSLNISGDKLYQEGDVDNAIAEFEKAILLDPQDVNIINSLGICYSSKGKYKKALDEFRKVMTLAPDDVMAPYNAGLTYLKMEDKINALEMFLKAHALDENQFEVAIQLGRLYLEMKDLEMARKYLEKAAELDMESGPAHRFLGECYNELSMIPEAVQSYSKAVKLNANDAYSLSALACIYARQKINQEIAIVFAKQSIDLSPATALFHYRLGKVYFLLDLFEEALIELKVALNLGHDCSSLIFEIENLLLASAS
jgi:tetratricopeptide (TPR) repeat protein